MIRFVIKPRNTIVRSGMLLGLALGFIFPGYAELDTQKTGAFQSHQAAGELLGDALIRKKIGSWQVVEKQTQACSQADRLVRNLSLKEEFSPEGRLIARVRMDGTRETITYDDENKHIYVWITSADGVFKEQRLYINKALRAVLYVGGTLKTLQYTGPLYLDETDKKPVSSEPSLFIILSSAKSVRILQYDSRGGFLGSFGSEGKPVLKPAQAYACELSEIVHPDELQFFSH